MIVCSLLLVFWIGCAVPAYGLLFAALDKQSSFMARSQERRNQRTAFWWAVFAGPVILQLWGLDRSNGGEHDGWKWRRCYDR